MFSVVSSIKFGNPYKNLAADKFYLISEPNAIRFYRVGVDITLERKLITLLTKIIEKTGSMKDYIVEQGTKDIWTYRYKTRERYTGLIIVFHFLQVYSLTYPL